MELVHWLTIGAVAVCWGVLVVTLVRWGPGVHRRRVLCPEKKKRASVLVEVEESSFSDVQAVDIQACSFFPNSPVNCEKECLTRL